MSDLGGPILRSQIRPFENSNSVSVSYSVINWIIFFPCIFVKLRQGSGHQASIGKGWSLKGP